MERVDVFVSLVMIAAWPDAALLSTDGVALLLMITCAGGNSDVVAMGAMDGVGVLGTLVSVDSVVGVAVGGSMMSDGTRVAVVGGRVGRAVVVVAMAGGSTVLSVAELLATVSDDSAATDSNWAVAAGVDMSAVVTRSRSRG